MFFYLNNVPIYCFKEYKNFTIIQYCDFLYLMIPRFCYHDKLSIAGNCRMCLIELNNGIKPVIACATNVAANTEIVLDSLLVKKARENVLEFLLINHPLDCPICDQGGECDLQDQALMYGSDRGRFKEMKRSVEDKELGTIVKTIMTRCIHCTRCIRFSEEILGVKDLGMIGRGSESEIKMNNVFFLDSELSGNIVDICPVGALTSKPFAFTARPWELKSIESIDFLDSLHSNIRIDVKGSRIMRVLPKVNQYINENWISDYTRFSYESLQGFRIKYPYLSLSSDFFSILEDQLFVRMEWEQCFEYAKLFFSSININFFNVVASYGIGLFNINLFYFLSKFIKNSVFSIESLPYCNIDLRNNFIVDDFFNYTKSNFLIFYDLDMKGNFSVFNSRFHSYLTSTYYKKFIFYIGRNIENTFSNYHIGSTFYCFFSLLRGKNLSNSYFFRLNNKSVSFNLFNSDISFNRYLDNLGIFDKSEVNNFCFFSNVTGYFENGINSELVEVRNEKAVNYFYKTNRIKSSSFFFYHGFYLPELEDASFNSNYIFLPSHTSFEVEDIYLNLFGDLQLANQVLDASEREQVRSDFYILKSLFSFFLYSTSDKVQNSVSFDFVLNELVFFYLNYYVVLFDIIPSLNIKKWFGKEGINNSCSFFYFSKSNLINLNIESTFYAKYSSTLMGFYKLRNMKKSNFF